MLVQGIHPTVETEIIRPSLKSAAVSPDFLKDRAEAAIAPRKHSLYDAGIRVVPIVYNVAGIDAGPQEIDTAQVLFPADLRFPLERAVGFGE